MKNPVCDFCLAGDVRWTFPCKTFTSPVTGDRSVGDWSACDDCKQLIEKDDWEGLAVRSVTLSPAFKGQALPDVVLAMIVQACMQLHGAFKVNRTGPVRPIGDEDRAGFEVNRAFCQIGEEGKSESCGKPATHDVISLTGHTLTPCCEQCGRELAKTVTSAKLVKREVTS